MPKGIVAMVSCIPLKRSSPLSFCESYPPEWLILRRLGVDSEIGSLFMVKISEYGKNCTSSGFQRVEYIKRLLETLHKREKSGECRSGGFCCSKDLSRVSEQCT